MRNLDAHFSCQDASLVLQCFYGLNACGQYITLAIILNTYIVGVGLANLHVLVDVY